MEVQETDRMVIAKPVASRPSLSNFRSFSALLSGAISATPPRAFSETTVSAVRPKTVRFKPTVSRSSIEAVSSLGEISGTEVCYLSDKVVVPESKSTVVYKPLAKLVSSKTVHVLANLGNFDITNQQTAATRVQPQLTSNLHRKLPPQMKTNQTIESLKMASQNMEENQRALSSTTSGDQPSYDGYNWRKYGQKQVKGSEYPRSYYKCTYPNCAVKKKVERSLDGQIAEIVYKGEHNHSKPQLLVYKGEHNHSKPQLLKRQCSGSQEQGFVSDGISQELGNPSGSNRVNERKEGSKGRKETKNEVGLLVNPSYTGKAQIPNNPIRTCNGVGTPDNSGGLSGDCEEASRGVDADDDEPKIKRRKNGRQSNEVGLLGQDVREPHIVVQNSTDCEILGDGFRWRKYGQKVVKGNPYPRSYYRCTNLKCNVRKHVERALDDPRAFISTYEGKHNHEMPTNLNLGASDPDSVTPTNKVRR